MAFHRNRIRQTVLGILLWLGPLSPVSSLEQVTQASAHAQRTGEGTVTNPAGAVRDNRQEAGESSNLIQGVISGTVTQTIHNYGIPIEEFRRLAGELAVTESALASFFNILEQQHVSRADLDAKLRAIAAAYKQLQAQLQQFLSEDPTVTALRREASQALETGDFAQVETLLHQAQERDLHAIQEQQASLRKRQLSAAAINAELGALKNIQLSYVAAAMHYRQAAALLPQEEALTHAEYLNYEGLAWIAAGQYGGAQPSLERALAIREKVLGPEHPDVAQSLNNLALLYRVQGRYAEAEPRYQRALAIREKVLGPEHPDVAQSLNNLAVLYHTQGRYAEAEPRYQRALAIWEKVLGPEHPDVALSLNNLAGLYDTQGQYAEAEPRYQRALAIREKVLGPEHPDVALSLNNLAVIYDTQGRYAEAEPRYQRALAIWEKVLGPEHPDVATSLNNLAGLYDTQGRYAEAEPRYQRALAIREKVLGPEHPNVATSLNNLALLYDTQGQYAEAEPRYQRALAILEKVLGPEHPNVALSLNNLAELYRVQGQYAEAEPRYQRALAILEKVLGPEHPNVAKVRKNYVAFLRATHRDADAAQLEVGWAAQQPPRAWLGIQMQRSIEPSGLLVEQVMAESPAAHAGIQPHDVIVRFNTQAVPDSETLLRLVRAAAIGTTVDVEIIRDGQKHTLLVTLAKSPLPGP